MEFYINGHDSMSKNIEQYLGSESPILLRLPAEGGPPAPPLTHPSVSLLPKNIVISVKQAKLALFLKARLAHRCGLEPHLVNRLV
jgi:hypothetical protein